MLADIAKGFWEHRDSFFWFWLGLMLMTFAQDYLARNSLGWAAYLMGVVLLVTVIGQTVTVIRKRRSGRP